jgi:hypothetical protein
MAKEYELNDQQWARIAEMLPGKKSDPGRTAKDNRLFRQRRPLDPAIPSAVGRASRAGGRHVGAGVRRSSMIRGTRT